MTVNPPNGQGDVTYTLTALDNLGEATETQEYLFCPQDIGGLVAEIDAAQGEATPVPLNGSSDLLLAQSVSLYDARGNVYESRTYNVAPKTSTSPSPGTVGDYLPTDTWYDADGNVLATRTGAGPIEKSVYNGAGEVVETYTCAESTATASLDLRRGHDPASAPTRSSSRPDLVRRRRQHDRHGRLPAIPGRPATGGAYRANSYVTASDRFYDAAGRDIEDVDYGARIRVPASRITSSTARRGR